MRHQGVLAWDGKILNFEVRLCYITAEALDNPGTTIIMSCRVWWTIFFLSFSFLRPMVGLELPMLDQAGLEITEIYISLPLECWDQKCMTSQPPFVFIFSYDIFTLGSKNLIQYLAICYDLFLVQFHYVADSLLAWLFGEYFSIRMLFNLTKFFQILS